MKNLVRNYFAFMIISVGTVFLLNNPGMQNYMTSVLHVLEDESIDETGIDSDPARPEFKVKMANANLEQEVVFKPEIKVDMVLDFGFEVLADYGDRYVIPGEKEKVVIGLGFEEFEEDFSFEHLEFSINGMGDESIYEARLMHQGDTFSKAEVIGSEMVFSDFRSKEFSSNDEVYLELDFSPRISSGKRLRLVIERPEDFVVLIDGKKSVFKQSFPVKGHYLTVVRKGF